MKTPAQMRIILAIIICFVVAVFLYKALAIQGLSPARFASLVIVAVIVVILVVSQILRHMAGRYQLDKGLNALNRECNPAAAIALHTQKLAGARAQGNETAEILLLNNLAVACHANGETERALDLLNSAHTGNKNAAIQMVHNGNIAILNWDAGHYDAFWRHKAIVDNFVREVGQKTPAYQAICRQMERIGARADILNGDYERALNYFAGQFKTLPAYDKYAQVSNRFIMAGIYYLMGDEANYRRSLQFVAEKGHRLHVAKLARERLATMAD